MEELITSMLSVVLAGVVISVIIVFIFILFIGINIAEKLSVIVVNKIERYFERYFERKALTDNWKRPWF